MQEKRLHFQYLLEFHSAQVEYDWRDNEFFLNARDPV